MTPDELLSAFWPDTYVNQEGLRRYIQEIRKVLGDRPDKPLFIQTLPKRGYQFIGPVVEESTARQSDIPAFVHHRGAYHGSEHGYGEF